MKQNQSKHIHWIQFRSMIILFILLLSAAAKGATTSSYDVTIQGQTYMPLAWHFIASTVGIAFPSPSDGQRIHIWNAGTQSFTSTTADEGWLNPDLPLNPGDGFLYENPAGYQIQITVGGTNNSVAATNSLVANNWYLLCSVYPQSTTNANFLECLQDSFDAWRHPVDSFHWPFANGDIVQMWDESLDMLIGGQRKATPEAGCSASGESVSTVDPHWWRDQAGGCFAFNGSLNTPQMRLGRAVWFRPSSNRTLIRTASGPTSCP